jgi:hypothetical protein
MPSHPGPLWILTLGLIVALPVLSFIYWPLVLHSGVLSPDADSIAIPMFSDVLVAVVFSPILLGATWLCLRDYNPDTRLMAWRRDRPLRSAAVTVVLGGPAVALAVLLIIDIRAGWPWYEHLWTGYALLWIAWLLALRAGAIERLDLSAA